MLSLLVLFSDGKNKGEYPFVDLPITVLYYCHTTTTTEKQFKESLERAED